MGDFDAILARLAEMERLAEQGAADGLRLGASGVQDALQATTAYNNDTGATRAGSVVYVVGEGVNDLDRVEAAAQAAEALNPGHSQAAPAGTVEDGHIAVVATSATDYADHLETEQAGARAFLGPIMLVHAQNLTQAAADGIKRALS